MLVITFFNSTISKSTSPAILLDSYAIEIYRSTIKTEVQRQFKDDGAHVSLVHKGCSIVVHLNMH